MKPVLFATALIAIAASTPVAAGFSIEGLEPYHDAFCDYPAANDPALIAPAVDQSKTSVSAGLARDISNQPDYVCGAKKAGKYDPTAKRREVPQK